MSDIKLCKVNSSYVLSEEYVYWKYQISSLSIKQNVILIALPMFTGRQIWKVCNYSRGSIEQTVIIEL